MTVETQMQQAIAGIQSAAATMKTFALETQDEEAKQTFWQIANNLDALMKLKEDSSISRSRNHNTDNNNN